MSKILKAASPEKCLGCEMCVYEAQRQMDKLGLEGSFIRIFRDGAKFSVVLDPQVNTLDVEKIKSVCPQDLFEVLEEGHELLE